MEEKIKKILAELRPFFEADNGDVTFVEVTKDLRVLVKLHGACQHCSMKSMTLKGGVEESIKRAIPEIKSVETIN